MDTPFFRCLDQTLMEAVALQSRNTPRQRQNFNFHAHEDKVQRFLNVLQPGTYIRPHRHRRPSGINGFEFFLVLEGELGLIIMNETGQILHTERISANGSVRGIELPEGTFHTLVALADNTVIFELKEGPYEVTTDKDFLTQFPLEGTPEAQLLVESWQQYYRSNENSSTGYSK